MKFYVNSWIFGNVELEEIVRRVAALGYDGIELVGEPKAYNPADVNKLAKGSGLKIISICGMYPCPEEHDLRALCHYDSRERGKAIDYVRQCVDLACGVGARSVLIVPSLDGKPGYFKSKEEDMI